MTVLFVSDLHLHPSRPAATDCFLKFLAGDATGARALYILGDLFEAWIGDDAASDHDRRVVAALRALTDQGTRCDVIPGNRDFLLGERFTAESGVALLPDESVVEVQGERVLLVHGDQLCTADRSYQHYRSVVHRPAVRGAYLALPRAARQWIAGFARRRSLAANAMKPARLLDVSPDAVVALMRRHRVRTLVHGHTHRPGIHALDLDGAPARRIVLGDWYDQGSVLHWSTGGPELRQLTLGPGPL